MARAGTPSEILAKLTQATNDAVQTEDVATQPKRQGFDPLGGSPQDFAAFVEKWKAAAAAAGLEM
jgi:tripartite-type tricarboxylate transporter receptor subunit TctC